MPPENETTDAPVLDAAAEAAAVAAAPEGDGGLIGDAGAAVVETDEAAAVAAIPATDEKVETDEEKTARETQEAADEQARVEALNTPFGEIKPPEGFETLDTDAMAAFTPVLRDLGVDGDERAQEVVNKVAPIVQGMVERALTQAADAQRGVAAEMQRQWTDAALADREIGGTQDNLTKTIAKCGVWLDAFATPDFRTFLKDTGLSNHPEMIRAIARASEHISEADIHRSDVTTPTSRSTGEVLYDDFAPPKT